MAPLKRKSQVKMRNAWKISMIFNKWHYWELNRPFSQEMNLEDEINHIHNKWIWKTAPFSHKMNLEDEINRIHNKWIWRINHFHKKWIWKIALFSHEMNLRDQPLSHKMNLEDHVLETALHRTVNPNVSHTRSLKKRDFRLIDEAWPTLKAKM
jgi:hypothetical protein